MSLKTLREQLCVAQPQRGEQDRWLIERMIELIDALRPLGPDGKHKDVHGVSDGLALADVLGMLAFVSHAVATDRMERG